METAADDSGIRKVLHGIVQAAWIMFCLFILYVTIVPFFDLLFGNRGLVFPYYSRYMPTFHKESVTSLQYFLSLGFMHVGYLVSMVFTHYIKKILQNSIAGRFYSNDTVKYIKKAALSFAYLVVCPLSIESAIYFSEEPLGEIIQILLLGYALFWTAIGVVTIIAVSVVKRFADLYEEQRLTV